MVDLDDLQKKLKGIAETVNLFKSEAVQLRVVEVLLGQLGPSGAPAPASIAELSKTPKKPRRRREKAPAVSPEGEAKPSRPTSRGSGSPGAYAMINELHGDGFFKAPKTIRSIIDHCGTARGHHYKPKTERVFTRSPASTARREAQATEEQRRAV